jgi:hypothetical protein
LFQQRTTAAHRHIERYKRYGAPRRAPALDLADD